MSIFDDLPADIERKKAELAKFDSPAEVAKRNAKREAEFQRHVELGWITPEGDPIPQDVGDERNDDDDESEDDE